MQFNIDAYQGKYVMHCKTEEEAKDFCNHLHSIGREWNGGVATYKATTNYALYGPETAYNFNRGTYWYVQGYENEGYTILEWEDFMNKEFTKADLKTGDVILRKNGDVEIFNRELEMFIRSDGGWNDFDCVDNDLSNTCYESYDIIAVRRPITKQCCSFMAFEYQWGTLVYERKEVEEMTLEQVCKLLGKEIKIIK